MNYRYLLRLMTGTALVLSLSSGAGVPASARPKMAATVQDVYQKIKFGKIEGAIVPRERAAEFVKALTGREKKEYWTPTKEDV
ncbi:MAG: hypothetical protein WCF57_22260, partial [Pyrinomonadaceae bacterium]